MNRSRLFTLLAAGACLATFGGCGNSTSGDVDLSGTSEAALLTPDEKVRASQACKNAGADFVKTSTGFSTGGATAEDVALMRAVVGKEIGVKAAGGVRNLDDLKKMVSAGATRIGASASVRIMEEALGHDKPAAKPASTVPATQY